MMTLQRYFSIISLCVVVTLALGVTSASALQFEGSIQSNYDQQGEWVSSTVDRWSFTLDAAATVTIDVLSAEIGWNEHDWSMFTNDVNGDGEIAFIDSMIHLFRDDGTLGADDYIAGNDDMDAVGVDGDGSIDVTDSFLELSLDAGSYIIAIGALDLSIDEAVAGVNELDYWDDWGGYYWSNAIYGPDFQEPWDHGDYRLTVSMEAQTQAPVPEPGTLVLLGLGIIGFVGLQRKLKK